MLVVKEYWTISEEHDQAYDKKVAPDEEGCHAVVIFYE